MQIHTINFFNSVLVMILTGNIFFHRTDGMRPQMTPYVVSLCPFTDRLYVLLRGSFLLQVKVKLLHLIKRKQDNIIFPLFSCLGNVFGAQSYSV